MTITIPRWKRDLEPDVQVKQKWDRRHRFMQQLVVLVWDLIFDRRDFWLPSDNDVRNLIAIRTDDFTALAAVSEVRRLWDEGKSGRNMRNLHTLLPEVAQRITQQRDKEDYRGFYRAMDRKFGNNGRG